MLTWQIHLTLNHISCHSNKPLYCLKLCMLKHALSLISTRILLNNTTYFNVTEGREFDSQCVKIAPTLVTVTNSLYFSCNRWRFLLIFCHSNLLIVNLTSYSSIMQTLNNTICDFQYSLLFKNNFVKVCTKSLFVQTFC